MSGKYSRTKGHDFERAVCTFLRERFPNRTIRRSQQGDEAYEPDVVVGQDIDEDRPPRGLNVQDLWIECNSSIRPNVFVKLKQAIADAEKHGNGKVPVVIAHKTRGETVVCMKLSDFSKWSGWG